MNADMTINIKTAEALFEKEDYVGACAKLEDAIIQLRGSAQQEQLAEALLLYGRTLKQLGRIQDSQAAFGESISIYESLGKTSLYGHALGAYGLLLIQIEDYPSAAMIFQKALDAHREAGDRVETGLDLLNMGVAFYNSPNMGRYKFGGEFSSDYVSTTTARAIKLWTEASAILLETKHVEALTSLFNLASAFRSAGCYCDVIECHYKALNFVRELNKKGTEASILAHLAADICKYPRIPHKQWEKIRVDDQERLRHYSPYAYFSYNGAFPKGYLYWSEDRLKQEVFSRLIDLPDPPSQLGLDFFVYIERQSTADAVAAVYWLDALDIYQNLPDTETDTENESTVIENLRMLHQSWRRTPSPEQKLVLPRIKKAVSI